MNTPTLCPECGRPLLATHQICPSCLLAQGLATATGGDAESALPDLQEIQARFPQFEILECLGRGGMGIVYKARQKSLNRLVAIKILAPEREHDSHFSARFSREAEILARLNHPHIVTIHDFGESGGLFYLVMEFVDGVNLCEILSEGRMEARQALAIVPEICDALQYAHDQGIVHRDIKPENILLDRSGRVKVADFGIAKLAGIEVGGDSKGAPARPNLTAAGKVLGTPAYMAPEQMTEPEKVDHRADIYAVGAVFYQMLTGETPTTAVAPPSRKVAVDVRLDEIVLRALEKDPERRYQQVSEVRTRLDTLNFPPTSAAAPKVSEKTPRPLFVAGLVTTIFLLIVVSLLAGAGVMSFVRSKMRLAADNTMQADQAWKLWNEQRFAEARAAFEKALKADPENANSWNGLGWSFFNSGNTVDAVPAFEKAVKLSPSMPGALNGLGQIALSKGDYGKAEEYLLRAAPMAPAAWFGLTRVYLLQGQYEKALPWAQKIVDSGQGGALASELLDAAKSGKLSDNLRNKISPLPVNASAASQPPKLRALAWLDNPRDAWNAEGKRFSLSDLRLPLSLATPPGVNVTETAAAAENPRFLSFWFSQAEIDNQSIVRVELLDSDGKPITTPTSNTVTGAERPSPETGNLGWLTATVCAGTMASTPDRVSIELHYSAGAWTFWNEIAPDMRGSHALSEGIWLTAPTQSNSGRATIQITRDKEFDTGNEQWDFVVFTRAGRRLERMSNSRWNSGNITTELFSFDAPLDQVARFEARKRLIKSITWQSVPLLSDETIVLEIQADGRVRWGGVFWNSENLQEKLAAIALATPRRAVVLKADPACPYSRITEVLNACAAAKIPNVSFAGQKNGDSF